MQCFSIIAASALSFLHGRIASASKWFNADIEPLYFMDDARSRCRKYRYSLQHVFIRRVSQRLDNTSASVHENRKQS